MELKIALVGNGGGWVQILNQLGVKYVVLQEVFYSDLIQYPVVIMSEDLREDDFKNVMRYLETGGALLTSAKKFYFGKYSKIIKEKYIKYIKPDDIGYFDIGEHIELYRKIIYHNHSEYLKSNSNDFTLSVLNYGDGKVVLIPFDAGKLYEDHSYVRKSFYAAKRRLPHERVAKVTKGSIRRLVNNVIEYLFHVQNLIYCHKWYFPEAGKNVFLFRVDTDFGTMKNIKDLYELAFDHNIPITWFVDVKSQEINIDYYKQMQNQELAIHCYNHKDYKEQKEFRDDINLGLEMLKKYEIFPKGFAAPYGKWNLEFGKIISDFKFTYSSEFSYDYDNLPSNDEFGNLQIPVHPICVGSLKRQGYKKHDMIDYFTQMLQRKMSLYEPIVFYHHPNDQNIEVIHHIFNKIKNLNVPTINFLNFAIWWNNRIQTDYSITAADNLLKIKIDNPSNIILRLTKSHHKETFIKETGILDVNNLNWQNKPIPDELPRDYCRVYKYNVWKIVNKIEDLI